MVVFPHTGCLQGLLVVPLPMAFNLQQAPVTSSLPGGVWTGDLFYHRIGIATSALHTWMHMRCPIPKSSAKVFPAMDKRSNALHTVATGENLGPVFLGVDWAVFCLSTIVVAIRLYTRAFVTRNPGWDDLMIALTQAITAVGKAFVVTEVSYGLGQHKSSLSDHNYRNFLKYYYLDTAQFFIALATCKISIALFLLRFSQFNKLRRILWSLIGFLILSHSTLLLLVVLQCNPIHKVWDKDVPGQCFSDGMVENINYAQAVLSFLTDFICAAFPFFLLRNLNIRRKSYIALCVLMGLGIVTGAIAIARTATTYQISSLDLPWDSIPNSMTRIFEVNIGNVAACAPIMKPFVRYVHAKITGKDPHQLLRRKSSDSEFHARWYRRTWWSPGRSSGSPDGRSAQGRQGTLTLPTATSLDMKAQTIQTETSRRDSAALPIQGTHSMYDQNRYNVPGVPNARKLNWFQLREIPRTDFRSFYEAKDAV